MIRPIAERNIGIDPEIGLEKVLKIWQFTVDAKAEKIVVVYDIDTLSPTGVVVNTQANNTYERYNSETHAKFDELRDSPIGQGITGLMLGDLQDYPDMAQL